MIEYRIRVSRRSRSVRLSVSHYSGVVVTVPSGFDTSEVPGIILRKEEWIKRSIEKIRSSAPARQIPARVDLRSIGRSFALEVHASPRGRSLLVEENDVLKLFVNPHNKRFPFALLRKWVRKKSKEILIPWLERVSRDHGLPYNSCAIRSQRTRWGSCSAKKNISLNSALLFLSPELVGYLMIHELCHTVEMNHSKKFWELVERHCTGSRRLDKELTSAAKSMEWWLR
ncbi:MAG TPA: SprT family zinc-dependent metalloprotease [Bacteroidota bacterium]|nr:SprT family zinc-dependent metalloprotease [Bacteroidota bacterium]